jgi:hypothetical protein
MRTDCIVKLSKLEISELNTLVQKETSDHVEGKPPPSDTSLSCNTLQIGTAGSAVRDSHENQYSLSATIEFEWGTVDTFAV